jgi:hypothetical protein
VWPLRASRQPFFIATGWWLVAVGYSVNGVAHGHWPLANSDNEEWMVFECEEEEIKLHGRLVPLD